MKFETEYIKYYSNWIVGGMLLRLDTLDLTIYLVKVNRKQRFLLSGETNKGII